MRNTIVRELIRFLCLPAVAMFLAGCAHVAFEHGATRLEDKALVFGRILLDSDGEQSVISTFSTPVVIRNIESADEPGLLTQSFEKGGRFYWSLPPGRYQLSLVLSQYAEGLKSYAFTVGKSGAAYYFGDVTFVGKKRFNTLGGANIKDSVPRLVDDLDRARDELLRKNPQLRSAPVERLTLRDMRNPQERGTAYAEALEAGRPCCARLAQLPYKPLAQGASRSESIGPRTALFDFPSGRSRFLAWELPRYVTPYTIALRSAVTPSGMPGTGTFYIFSPAVMLLDAGFNVLSDQDRGIFQPLSASMLPPRSASLRGELQIAAANATARYMVVYTSRPIIEGTWRTSMPGFSPAAGGVIPTGVAMPLWMEPAISGVMDVALEPR